MDLLHGVQIKAIRPILNQKQDKTKLLVLASFCALLCAGGCPHGETRSSCQLFSRRPRQANRKKENTAGFNPMLEQTPDETLWYIMDQL